MVSCRILCCLFLTLLLQYGDAWNSRYMESILTSLQRIENMLVKQTEQNVLSCTVPCEKLFNMPSDNFLNAHDEKTDEASSHGQLDMLKFRRAMSNSDEDSDDSPKRILKRQRQKNRNRNENLNSNTNTNINSNKLRLLDFDNEYD